MLLKLNLRLRQTYSSQLSIEKYVIASRMGGQSSDKLYEHYSKKYINMSLSHLKVSNKLPGVTIVTEPHEAQHCLRILMDRTKHRIAAWDTETIDLDPKKQTPVGKGRVVCASVFAGPEFDFGNGPGLFIDNFGQNAGLLQLFKPYLENPDYLKCWHNYGFDRHVLYNHGIDVKGLGADTMHMARLFDPSSGPQEYSLSKLTQKHEENIQLTRREYIKKFNIDTLKKLQDPNISSNQKQQLTKQLQAMKRYQQSISQTSILRKRKLEQLFRRKKTLRTGEEGKTYEYPSILTLHTSSRYLPEWIKYSVRDSESTFFLRQTFQKLLTLQKSRQYPGIPDMFTLYNMYWRRFGQVLTEMQRQGIQIDKNHIREVRVRAQQDAERLKNKFIQLVAKLQAGAQNIELFNPSSTIQMQQLLHAPFQVQKQTKQELNQEDQELHKYDNEDEEQESPQAKKANRKQITQLPALQTFDIKNQANKTVKLTITGFGIPATKVTPTGLPSVDHGSLVELAGDPANANYGKAYTYLKSIGKQQLGKQVCEALGVLIQFRNTQTLVKTFIEPLCEYAEHDNRVHCSLNINTETGRLSARKPNLQNQPALQKDIYKIRKTFRASAGKKLIVADYGQLELRVLAHITNCSAMIDAFKQGGDFHSRTAIGMFDYIRKDVEEGKILLEWDKSKGTPPVPLLKDKYASERRKAKTMNFSIAYGKTAHGFAKDWKCTIKEAEASLEAWFASRTQVKEWQQHKQAIARSQKLTQTLLGRFRYLYRYFHNNSTNGVKNMGYRRAINTPIQGGAADIVIAAMVRIADSEQLKSMGWKLLLQVHDELILEGPEHSAKQALAIVKQLMEDPLPEKFRIAMEVDAKIGNNWYECK